MMKIMPQLVYLGAWQKTSEKIINDKIAGKKNLLELERS